MMSRSTGFGPANLSPQEEALRPLYSRVLRLNYLDPGGLLCFAFFEGTIIIALLLALAELVYWWGVPVLPVLVAILVKLNDVVAGAVVRSAAGVPRRERERLQRELAPVVGRAVVPGHAPDRRALPAGIAASAVLGAVNRRSWPTSRPHRYRLWTSRLPPGEPARRRSRQTARRRYR